ncbi:MAG: hypothetical protein ACLT3Y_00945 [Ruminococcus callidus]
MYLDYDKLETIDNVAASGRKISMMTGNSGGKVYAAQCHCLNPARHRRSRKAGRGKHTTPGAALSLRRRLSGRHVSFST